MSLTDLIQKRESLRSARRQAKETWQASDAQMGLDISALSRQISLDEAMIDAAKIDLARTVIYTRGTYGDGVGDRPSVISDAIHEIATGTKPAKCYRGLDQNPYGVKDYSHWIGQRADHDYGFGPKYGSIVFQVGLTKDMLERGGVEKMNADEREAALYLLTRIQAVEAAERAAA